MKATDGTRLNECRLQPGKMNKGGVNEPPTTPRPPHPPKRMDGLIEITKYSVFLEDVPSENTMYPTNMKTGIRFLSGKGKDFRSRAILAFKQEKFPRFPTEPLVMELVAYWRNMRRADSGNYIKAIQDALKVGEFVEDDWIILPRCIKYYYPDDPKRDLKVFPKGLQGFLVTVYEDG